MDNAALQNHHKFGFKKPVASCYFYSDGVPPGKRIAPHLSLKSHVSFQRVNFHKVSCHSISLLTFNIFEIQIICEKLLKISDFIPVYQFSYSIYTWNLGCT